MAMQAHLITQFGSVAYLASKCLIGIQLRTGVNLIGLRSLPGPLGLQVSGYVLLGSPGVGVVLLDLVVVRDVSQLLLVRTYS